MKQSKDEVVALYTPAVVLNNMEMLQRALQMLDDMNPVLFALPASHEGPDVKSGPIVPAFRFTAEGLEVLMFRIVQKMEPVEVLESVRAVEEEIKGATTGYWPFGYLVLFKNRDVALKFRDELCQERSMRDEIPVVEIRRYDSGESAVIAELISQYSAQQRVN
jgi:hypothetical protein